ncbi:MAG TPA: hypothetical protein VLA13_07245 [Massilibacterium sp.]|nr:hypothetical protein [Massilibacterium sp.]
MYTSFLSTCEQIVPKKKYGSLSHIRSIQRLLAAYFPFENLDVLQNEKIEPTPSANAADESARQGMPKI